jgi:CDP-diacylglycerol---glycerol-3-phosphate 3-phosphatidyltransferase
MTSSSKTATTFTQTMRLRMQGVLEPVARFLLRLGLSANAVTLIGVAGNAVGGIVLALGFIPLGGWILLFVVPLDAIDGTMARLSGTTSKAGAFLDSVTDRWSEVFLFGGLTVWCVRESIAWGVLACFAAITGSLLVSYTKARAEGLGMTCNVGLLTRMERYIIILPALIFNLPLIGAGIIAGLAYSTAVQRMLYVLRPAGSSPETTASGNTTF